MPLLVARYKFQIKASMRGSPLKQKQFWDTLAESLEKNRFLEVKLWLVEALLDFSTISFVISMCKTSPPFSTTQSPIKTCLLYEEVLYLFKRQFSIHKDLIESKQEQVLGLCKNFIEEIETESKIREILRDTDIKGRTVETLIKRHPQLLLKLETVVENKWTSSVQLFSR